MADYKLLFSIVAIAISGTNLVYYLYTVYRGNTRPHLYSWLIWGLVTSVVAIAQYAEKGGAGAFVTAFAGFACFTRVIAALTHGEKEITRSDTICLVVCCVAIILWPLTNSPLWSVLLVTAIDVAGFYPTVRKSWHKPQEENALSYVLFAVVYFLSITGLQNYNFTTLFYPVVMVAATLGFVAFLLIRRKAIK
ncbi:MAG: hypothetical protein GC136_04355 [Alphaproteobacteria bacterium]|nr:hypothetical protein [Alphaproteobacteria bacterium]